MFGHEDVAEDIEAMALSSLFEDVEKNSPGVVIVQGRESAIAAECDEVVVAKGVVALKTARHAVDGQGHTPLIAMIPR